jgi:uncharacterized protein (DUF302 family)
MRCPRLFGAVAAGLISTGALAHNESGIEHVMTESDFATVVEQLHGALDDKGLTLMITVNHAENAANNDMTLPPTTTFIFGNPKVGTPMMQCLGSVALDLPQKMLVRDTDDGVRIEWNDPHYLAERHGLQACDLPLDKVADVLRDVAQSAAQ